MDQGTGSVTMAILTDQGVDSVLLVGRKEPAATLMGQGVLMDSVQMVGRKEPVEVLIDSVVPEEE